MKEGSEEKAKGNGKGISVYPSHSLHNTIHKT